MKEQKNIIITKRRPAQRLKQSMPYYLMLLPGMVLLFIFNYLPLYGWKIAFQKFIPAKGLFGDQKWVGLYWFQYISKYPDFIRALRNTLMISLGKLALGILIAILFSILINEIRNSRLKRTVQTIVYLPHFLSWIILSGVLIDILSPSTGIVNKLIMAFGGQSAFFLGDNRFFQGTMIVTDIWKGFGFGTVVYLAALTSIDPGLYESAILDGATRWQQIRYITLPLLMPTIILMLVLALGNVLNAGFDQIFNLYSPIVYQTGDIIDTYVYRLGIQQAQYSVGAAIGLFKSAVSAVLVLTSYILADKCAGYKIF